LLKNGAFDGWREIYLDHGAIWTGVAVVVEVLVSSEVMQPRALFAAFFVEFADRQFHFRAPWRARK